MQGIDGEELPTDVSVEPVHSVDSVDEDDDWVIVKKQRITILIPPPSPAAASPQDGTVKICSELPAPANPQDVTSNICFELPAAVSPQDGTANICSKLPAAVSPQDGTSNICSKLPATTTPENGLAKICIPAAADPQDGMAKICPKLLAPVSPQNGTPKTCSKLRAPASSQDGMPKTCSKQTSLLRRDRRNCNAARLKHAKQLTTKTSQDCLEHVPRIRGELSSPSPATPVVKSEWTNHAGHAVQGLFQDTRNVASSFQHIYKPKLPIVSSRLTRKVMRARLLESRVAGFGGLRNWLLAYGLGWFVEILDSERLGMYQVVSLTMNQLKEMGLVAVGPRRKLIHAIDSLCQPYQPHQPEMVS